MRRQPSWSRGLAWIGPLAVLATALSPVAAAGVAPPRDVKLPTPIRQSDPLAGIGLLPDRLLTSKVPGRVDNAEAVTVQVGSSGAPTSVTDDQRLALTGTGSYVIRERGPARDALALDGTVPPVLELGTVVWQGFSAGQRSLHARLRLDPDIESSKLPLGVTISFRDDSGASRPLRPGLIAPTPGVATITLTNRTAAPRPVPNAQLRLGPLTRSLDRLRASAGTANPPYAGSGLPVSLPGAALSAPTQSLVVAPLRVTGQISAAGGSVTGPGITSNPGGGSVDGVLASSTQATVTLASGSRLRFALQVTPTVDARSVVPLDGATSWLAWARGGPSRAERRTASATLLSTAAQSARAAEFSPYLQADVPGPDRTAFRYSSESPPVRPPPSVTLRPRAGAIAVAGLAVLAILVNAALLRRRL